ncbi:MAG TPA: exodeoxyribonuclease III [Cytophagales bacterium]|jgi:exodeoxyribonuclease-3|nr:exodeoxyribonuclease III [Cytophagales bacterium]
MKIISWNVNGIRAILKKDFLKSIKALDADILCLQETKAMEQQVKEVLSLADHYEVIANASKEKKGYSGTAILSKTKPLSVQYDMGISEHDQEGRVIAAEFNDFYVINVYVPNSGSELVRLDYRAQWDKDFLEYLKKLENKKPVIVCGDFNVAHQPIDIARPKANYNKSAGYTQKEIDGFTRFTETGLVDSFRHFYPEKENIYSWWSYRAGARAKNVGWRIDYCLVSESLMSQVKGAFILNEYMGSDHCPVGIELR